MSHGGPKRALALIAPLSFGGRIKCAESPSSADLHGGFGPTASLGVAGQAVGFRAFASWASSRARANYGSPRARRPASRERRRWIYATVGLRSTCGPYSAIDPIGKRRRLGSMSRKALRPWDNMTVLAIAGRTLEQMRPYRLILSALRRFWRSVLFSMAQEFCSTGGSRGSKSSRIEQSTTSTCWHALDRIFFGLCWYFCLSRVRR